MKTDEAKALLTTGFETNRLAQGYILVGPVRGAAEELAQHVLQLVFCTGAESACTACLGCRQTVMRTHPDLFWVEPHKKSRIISVEQVRELEQKVFQTSFAGGWKAAVLAGADRLGKEAANAFLKTLEEPPDRTVFLLLTDSPQSLLPTIISRCQCVTLAAGADALPEEWRREAMAILSDSAGGTMIEALGRADRMAALFKKVREAAKEDEIARAEAESVEETDETLDARAHTRYMEMRTALMRWLVLFYRDLLVLVCGATSDIVLNGDELVFLEKQAERLTYRRARANVETVEEMNRLMERNLSENVALSYGFSRLS